MLPRDPRRGSFFDLSDRVKLRLTGSDRIRFLNGQITNDVGKATEASAIAACVLNARGKLNAQVFVSLASDCILIDGESSLNETLSARMERYIIADDVEIEDVSAQFSLFHAIGKFTPPPGGRVLAVTRFSAPGFDIWIDASQHDELGRALAATLPFCDQTCAETFRIEQGIPTWGRELTDEIIPVEANLEESCVDYSKGCYIGQEVISRMKMSGQRNKSLCGLISIDNVPFDSGMRLYPAGTEKKEAGWITSATRSDRLGKFIALGYVRRPFNRAGMQLKAHDSSTPAGSAVIPVEVVTLPFAV